MANSLPTKAFLQPAKTATMCTDGTLCLNLPSLIPGLFLYTGKPNTRLNSAHFHLSHSFCYHRTIFKMNFTN